MKNFVQNGDVITVTAPTAKSGDFVKIGSLVGFAIADADEFGDVGIVTKGVFEATVDAASNVDIGDTIFATAGGDLTTDGTENDPVGVAVSAATASATASVNVKI